MPARLWVVWDLPLFTQAPDSGKLAVAGMWEDAVLLQPGMTASERMARQLVGRSNDVACEAFFGAAFFGVRQVGERPELVEFVQTFTAILEAANNGQEFFAGIRAELGVPVGRDFTFAELGAEGAWQSVGPVRVDDPAAALADFDSWWAMVAASSVGRDTGHDKALEFSYANGDATEHWFGIPVSHGGVLDRSAVRTALELYD